MIVGSVESVVSEGCRLEWVVVHVADGVSVEAGDGLLDLSWSGGVSLAVILFSLLDGL